MKANIEEMFPHFYCVDKPSDLYFFGDYTFDAVSGLNINFVECESGNNSCLTKEKKITFFEDTDYPFFFMTLTN